MDQKVINQEQGENWTAYNGDCAEVMAGLPSDSVHYSIYSVPFSALYCFSDLPNDFSNCKTEEEFFTQIRFMARELLRVTKPGRLTSCHCTNLSRTKNTHGAIGIYDFRGALIRAFEDEGWQYHAEVCIWKDPVMAMQRTKAIGLLHKQLKKDSSLSRAGLPDYLVTLRKPGVNAEPIAGELTRFFGEMTDEEFTAKVHADWSEHKTHEDSARRNFATAKSIKLWQAYASPVWFDINPSDTLQYRSTRAQEDEKHICPLQLQVIERGINLWSNPGDIVLSPFMGIGSEGYVALEHGRRFIGVELKKSYFEQSIANLRIAENKRRETLLL